MKKFGQAIVCCTIFIFGWLVSLELLSQEIELRCDPSKVMTVEACAKCHANEVQAWRQTPHFKTFETLHRNPRAKEIAGKLGLRSIKRSDVCIDCHYTMKQSGERLRAVSGVSCESCHGASMDWLDLHNDYGGPTATKDSESEAHSRNRVAESINAGMRNPRNTYLIARSCLECHTVPNEKLVNVGGHRAGTSDFEFVAWSQGMVRHNFLRTNGTSNAKNDQNTLREMYVVGLIADLEFSTRATAKATSKSNFGLTAAQRSADVSLKLYEIQQEIKNPVLQRVLESFAQAELRVNNSMQLEAIADQIKAAGIEFAMSADGSTMAAIDRWLPAESEYKNTASR